MNRKLLGAGLALALGLLLGACGACTAVLVYGMEVHLSDSTTGQPVIADGVVVIAASENYADTVRVSGVATIQLIEDVAGIYVVDISVPGYTPWRGLTEVEDDGCHVRTRRVDVSLTPGA